MEKYVIFINNIRYRYKDSIKIRGTISKSLAARAIPSQNT